MKTLLKMILVAMISFTVTDLAAAGFDVMRPACGYRAPGKKMEKVVFSVNLHCGKCVEKINANIAFEKGVKRLYVSLERHIVEIVYDASKTDKVKLAAALEKLGYKVSELVPADN